MVRIRKTIANSTKYVNNIVWFNTIGRRTNLPSTFICKREDIKYEFLLNYNKKDLFDLGDNNSEKAYGRFGYTK